MKDDIFKRFIKSIGIMFGCFLFLYCMIVTTQKHPKGIALTIVVATEFISKGLIYLFIVSGIFILATILIEKVLAKKRINKEQVERIERERQSEIIYLKQEINHLKSKLEEVQDEKIKVVVALNEEKKRRIEFEDHLKNRSPQAAVNEALGHFL